MHQIRRAPSRLIRRRDRGAATVEYGLLASLIVVVVVIVAVAALGGQVSGLFTKAAYAVAGEEPPGTPEPARMVLTYDTTAPGCADTTIKVHARGSHENPASGTVDWGDGTSSALQNFGTDHTYGADGIYTVTIDGTFEQFGSNDASDAPCLIRVDEWGDTETTSAYRAFAGATNLTHVDTPPATITDAQIMFSNAASFDGDLSGWDTSNVTNMTGMFSGASSFTGRGLETWNTSNVTKMPDMFKNASAFNGDISGWDTGKVTDMRSMFSNASSFNRDLSGWNVSAVTQRALYDLGAGSWLSAHKPVFN